MAILAHNKTLVPSHDTIMAVIFVTLPQTKNTMAILPHNKTLAPSQGTIMPAILLTLPHNQKFTKAHLRIGFFYTQCSDGEQTKEFLISGSIQNTWPDYKYIHQLAKTELKSVVLPALEKYVIKHVAQEIFTL